MLIASLSDATATTHGWRGGLADGTMQHLHFVFFFLPVSFSRTVSVSLLLLWCMCVSATVCARAVYARGACEPRVP
jgi:hypothetical protein